MTLYPITAYPPGNPNAGYPANGDRAAWGGWGWPAGVPARFLGEASYANTTTNSQVLRVIVRRELVPLWQRAFAIADRIHHYPINSRGPDGRSWGPWGYSNRPIAGTQRASGHSFALSVDVNAPDNPYSTTWRCTIPPGLAADWESLGLYWGGRYRGQKYDPMHFGYCRTPADVPGSVARADAILGTTPAPPTTPEDPVTPADIDSIAKAVVKQLMGTAVVPFNDPATPGIPVQVSFQNLLPKLGNWAAVTNDNVNDLAGKA